MEGAATAGGSHMEELGRMAEVKQEVRAPPVADLEVILTCPVRSGTDVWPRFCFLEASIGGKLVDSHVLPIEKETFEQEKEDRGKWRLALRIPVGADWPSLSLDLVVERVDYNPWRKRFTLIRGGAHTTKFEAVIARARVPLIDALLVGDDDDEDVEGEDRKRRRREEEENRRPRLEGTLAFCKTVTLHDWEVPPLGSAYRVPRPVVRGTVDVRMCLKVPSSK